MGKCVGFALFHFRAAEDHHRERHFRCVGDQSLAACVCQRDLRTCRLVAHADRDHALLGVTEGLGEIAAGDWKSGELFTYYHDWLFEKNEEKISQIKSLGFQTVPINNLTDRQIAMFLATNVSPKFRDKVKENFSKMSRCVIENV